MKIKPKHKRLWLKEVYEDPNVISDFQEATQIKGTELVTVKVNKEEQRQASVYEVIDISDDIIDIKPGDIISMGVWAVSKFVWKGKGYVIGDYEDILGVCSEI